MSDLVGWWCLQHVAKKHRAIANHQFSPLQTFENLHPIVPSKSGLDDSLHKMVAVRGYPGHHRAIRFADHTIGRYSSGFYRDHPHE